MPVLLWPKLLKIFNLQIIFKLFFPMLLHVVTTLSIRLDQAREISLKKGRRRYMADGAGGEGPCPWAPGQDHGVLERN